MELLYCGVGNAGGYVIETVIAVFAIGFLGVAVGVGVVYAVVAVDLLFKGNTGLGIAFIGYALGNVGLYMEAAK